MARDSIEAAFQEIAEHEAALDPDLRAYFELKMKGSTQAVPAKRAKIIEQMPAEQEQQLFSEVRREYDLSPDGFKRTIGYCIADIAGVEVGEEFFHGET